VALVVPESAAFPDNWIYIHDNQVKVGRIQKFRSWSPEMVPDPSVACVGLEYFCFEGDGLWSLPDAELVDLATRELALRLGVIDHAATDLAQAGDGADVVILATPVGALAPTMRAIAPHLASNAVITDVGSTKSDVVRHAQDHLGAHIMRFVPAHPIAGKEVAGIEHADATLYRERQVILTPLPENSAERVLLAHQVWQALGSRVLELSSEDHDASFAAVSHLPHLTAFALVCALAAVAAVTPGFAWARVHA